MLLVLFKFSKKVFFILFLGGLVIIAGRKKIVGSFEILVLLIVFDLINA